MAKHLSFDARYLRPTEVEGLCGDASKARACLGWKPHVGFRDLVRLMVASDLKLAERERLLEDAGHAAPPSAESGR